MRIVAAPGARQIGEVAAWTPLLLGSALKAWWRASDLSDGAVSAWADVVGALSLDQGTGAAQPVKSTTSFNSAYAGVTFDGVDDFLLAASTTGLPSGSTAGAIWAVVDVLTGDSNTIFNYGGSGADTFRRIRVASTTFEFRVLTSASGGATGTGSIVGKHILRGTFSGTTAGGSVDGVAITNGVITTLNTGTTRTVMGATTAASPAAFLHMVVSDVFVPTTLTAGQVQQLEGYIAHNRGLTSLLASDHPFKLGPP